MNQTSKRYRKARFPRLRQFNSSFSLRLVVVEVRYLLAGNAALYDNGTPGLVMCSLESFAPNKIIHCLSFQICVPALSAGAAKEFSTLQHEGIFPPTDPTNMALIKSNMEVEDKLSVLKTRLVNICQFLMTLKERQGLELVRIPCDSKVLKTCVFQTTPVVTSATTSYQLPSVLNSWTTHNISQCKTIDNKNACNAQSNMYTVSA